MTKLNIAFFGSSSFVIPILENVHQNQSKTLLEITLGQLEKLKTQLDIDDLSWPKNIDELEEILLSNQNILEKEINLKCVVSQPDRQNRNKVVSNPVVEFSRKNSLQVFLPEKINKAFDEFVDLVEDDLGLAIVASFGQIISEKILNQAKYGFINWHPSKLPLYRGPTPIQTAIALGEAKIALSWIQMTRTMDAGNVLLQAGVDLENTDDFIGIAEKMGELGSQTWAIVTALQILERDGDNLELKVLSLKQDINKATFSKILTKEDKIVDPDRQSASEIYNHFKAYIAFPGTTFHDKYFDQEIKIVDCGSVFEKLPDSAEVYFEKDSWMQIKAGKGLKTYLKCSMNTYLEICKITLVNGKQVDFKGYKFN